MNVEACYKHESTFFLHQIYIYVYKYIHIYIFGEIAFIILFYSRTDYATYKGDSQNVGS